jgi:transposase-like protein
MEQVITIATFNSRPPADALAAKLKDAGIEAGVFDEGPTQRIWFWVKEPRAHMRVRIPREFEARANELLASWDQSQNILREAVRCPDCKSSRIEYPQFSRRAALTFFFAILQALGFFPRQYFCRTCHFQWENDEDAAAKLAQPKV